MFRKILLVLAVIDGLAVILDYLGLAPFLGILVVLFGIDSLFPKIKVA